MCRKFVEEKIAEYKRELAWWNFKNALWRIVRFLLCAVILFGLGYLFGMHHTLVKSWIKGEEIPEAPEGCWWKK